MAEDLNQTKRRIFPSIRPMKVYAMSSFQTIELFPIIRDHIVRLIDGTISESTYLSAAKLRQLLLEQNIHVSIKLCVNLLQILEVLLHLQTAGKSFKYYIIKKQDRDRLKSLEFPKITTKTLKKYLESVHDSQSFTKLDYSYII